MVNKPTIRGFEQIAPLLIQKYERYLPNAFDESMTMLQKVNKMIEFVNIISRAVDDFRDNSNQTLTEFLDVINKTIDDYEKFHQDILNDILPESTANKLDEWFKSGKLAEIINGSIFSEINKDIDNLTKDKMDKNTTDISIYQIDKNKGKFDQSFMSESLLQQIAGTAPINAVPADGSITTLKYADKSIEASKLHSQFRFRKHLDAGQDLDTIQDDGLYFLTSVTNKPTGISLATMEVKKLLNRWIIQTVTDFSDPGVQFARRIDGNTNTPTEWVALGRQFRRVVDDGETDTSKLLAEGYYYVGNVKGKPTDIDGGFHILENKVVSTFIVQEIYNVTNPVNRFTRAIAKSTGLPVKEWQPLNPSDVKLPYLTDQDNLNDYISPGHWIAIQPINAPESKTYMVEVKNFDTNADRSGFWGIQTATKTATNEPETSSVEKWERVFYKSPAGLTFGEWKRIDRVSGGGGSGNELAGAQVVNIGDSIFGNTRGAGSVSSFIADRTGATVHNIGFGGSRIAQHSPYWDAFSLYRLADEIVKPDTDTTKWQLQDEAIARQLSGMPFYFAEHLENLKKIDWSKVQYVTIAGGTNDYTASVPVDNPDNPHDTVSFAGSLRYSLEKLMGKHKHLKVLLCTPMYRFWRDETGNFIDDSDVRAYDGQILPDFVEKEKEVAREYKIPVLDNYYELGINFWNKEHYFPSNDGTHPNANGNEKLGRKIGSTLISEF